MVAECFHFHFPLLIILSCARCYTPKAFYSVRFKPVFILCVGLKRRADRGFHAEAVLAQSHGCADIKELTAEEVYRRHSVCAYAIDRALFDGVSSKKRKWCLLIDGTAQSARQRISVTYTHSHVALWPCISLTQKTKVKPESRRVARVSFWSR